MCAAPFSPSPLSPHAFDASDPVALAQALIRCPSVTPEEGGALALLDRMLAGAGFAVHRPVFSEGGTPDVENLYARIGSASPVLVIAGHTDVVPVGDEAGWRHAPFSGEIIDGVMYGRGACDMKGGLAAMTAAAISFVRANPAFPGSIAFLVTGDEEGPAINGTVKLLDWAKARGERFDHCLLGEPTNPVLMGEMVKIGRRGSLSGRVTVHGKQGHVAYPHLTDNPVRAIVKLLSALDAKPLDAGTEHFAPSNLECTTLDVGNPATNVVPARASAAFNIRFNDIWTPESLEAEIRRRLEGAGVKTRWELAMEPTNAVAFLTKPGPFVAMLADAIEAETGMRPALSTTGGTSDARFIKDHCEVVEFGTVGQTMHQVDECVALSDLEALKRITLRLMQAYFTGRA
jgi:succinyl-diaminopimelate desuccinylase